MIRLNNSYFFAFLSNHLIYYPTPLSLTYTWSFGFLAGMCLVTQMISGIFLAMHYTPHVDLAFSSVEYIMRNVPNGWFLRYVHANGASMFFIVVYSHIFRCLYYGSYYRTLLKIVASLSVFTTIFTFAAGDAKEPAALTISSRIREVLGFSNWFWYVINNHSHFRIYPNVNLTDEWHMYFKISPPKHDRFLLEVVNEGFGNVGVIEESDTGDCSLTFSNPWHLKILLRFLVSHKVNLNDQTRNRVKILTDAVKNYTGRTPNQGKLERFQERLELA